MMRNTDVFVIGGGPAGLATAIAARQRGLDVVVADGAEPPIDKACGEGLMPETVAVLHRLGIRLNPSDGCPFRGIRFIDDHAQVEASFPFSHGIGLKRTVLHQKMIERAQQVGVTMLWKTPVTALCRDGVIAGGQTIASRWVIGADGIGSRVRRWAGLGRRSQSRLRYAWRKHYSLEPWSDKAEIYWASNAQGYVTPVGSREVCVVVISCRPGMSPAISNDFPKLAERLAPATTENRERGAVTLSFRLDHVCTKRLALVGDASGSVDAITGDGLCLSFLQAEALAEALEAGNLSAYQKAHRRLTRLPALMSRLLLLLDGHPALRHRTISVMAAHPHIFSRMLSVHVGACSTSHLASTGVLLGWRLLTA